MNSSLGKRPSSANPKTGSIPVKVRRTNAAATQIGSSSATSSATAVTLPKHTRQRQEFVFTGRRFDEDSSWRTRLVDLMISACPKVVKSWFNRAKPVFVTVDTNIWIGSDMEETKKALFERFGDNCKILIPYTVTQEIDHLAKAQTSCALLLKYAQNANVTLNAWLTTKVPGVITESQMETAQYGQSFYGITIQTNDDKILVSCLRQSEVDRNGRLILFTKDKNLQSKAIVKGIDAVLTMLKAAPSGLNGARQKSPVVQIQLPVPQDHWAVRRCLTAVVHQVLYQRAFLWKELFSNDAAVRPFALSSLNLLRKYADALLDVYSGLARGGDDQMTLRMEKILGSFTQEYRLMACPVSHTELTDYFGDADQDTRSSVANVEKQLQSVQGLVRHCQLLLTPTEIQQMH